MTDAQQVVSCRGASKFFGPTAAADDVTFDLGPGEILSILGPSGCGKTTLLRLIAGFERVDAGEIRINGRLVSSESVHVPPEQRSVGMVFQDYALFPHMTVGRNISFGIEGLPPGERGRRTAEVLDLVELTGFEDRYPHELSGGQQQRVALARTIAPRPIAVLLDEPFSNLDATMRHDMRLEVEGILRDHGIATVFVTHDREEAFAMADRLGVMVEGRLEQLDAPETVYRSPTSPQVARLAGSCDFLTGRLSGGHAVTEIGPLPAAGADVSLPEGCGVDLLVRPDAFRVETDDAGELVVSSREFRGEESIITVSTPSGARLRCRQRSDSALSPGTRVRLEPADESPFLAFPLAE